MNEVYESLYKSLSEAIEIDQGRIKTKEYPAAGLPAETLVGMLDEDKKKAKQQDQYNHFDTRKYG